MEIENLVFLSLGSNLGDKSQNLADAISLIRQQIGNVIKVSSTLQTEPVGFESSDLFLNNCILVQTNLSPQQVLEIAKKIESNMGRTPRKSEQYESRIIDIDIVLFGNISFIDTNLQIPHPRFREREFVLKPLLEIAPNQVDPMTSLTISQLYKLNFPKPLTV